MITYKSNKYLGLELVHYLKISTKKLKKLALTGVLSVTFALLLCSFNRDEPKGIKIVVIDAGHGGTDPGCNGVSNKEKDVSLAVALKLGKLIEENNKDVKVIYTRTTDVFVQLEDRAKIANKSKADLFISIHCNAAGKPVIIKDKKTGKKRIKKYKNKKGKWVVVETINPIPFGSETYVMGLKNEEGKMKVAQRENSVILLEENYEKKYEGFDPESEESYIIMSNYTSAYVLQSATLGVKIQEEYAKKAGRVDRGVHRQSIWVLWRTAMPSILTEIGYLTNPLEEQFLASEKGQTYIASSIYKGFRKYKDEVEGKKKEYNDDLENMEPLENENLKVGNTGKTPKEDEEEIEIAEKDSLQPHAIEAPKNNEKIETLAEIKKDIKEEEKEIEKTDSAKAVKTATVVVKEKDAKAEEVKRDSLKLALAKSMELKENKPKPVKKDSAKTAPTPTVAIKEKEKPKEKEKEKEKEIKAEPPKENKTTGDEIAFKVQFAGSDKELDLKQNKYSAIENGWYYKVGNAYKYTSGNFKESPDAFKHQSKLREAGFKDCFVVAFKNGARMDINEAIKLTKKP